jgi:hypothetical protein
LNLRRSFENGMGRFEVEVQGVGRSFSETTVSEKLTAK